MPPRPNESVDHGRVSKRRREERHSCPEAPRFDFIPLIENDPELKKYASKNANGKWRIDFSRRNATLALSSAILRHHYDISLTLPSGQLVPTIPNRVQYLKWAANLLPPSSVSSDITVLDIGTGPSCIYPMLGARLFPKWTYVAIDSDISAVKFARMNCRNNNLTTVTVFDTSESNDILSLEVLEQSPDLTVCNPPFHDQLPLSEDRAGTKAQLVTEGGEFTFLKTLALESKNAASVSWFTSFIGRKSDVSKITSFLNSSEVRAVAVRTAELSPGGRTTRWAVAWSFGSSTTTATIVPEKSTTWRQVVAVHPSRKYANQMVPADIASVFQIVLGHMDWETEARLEETAHGYIICSKRSAVVEIEDCCLRLYTAAGKDEGRFEVHLKVENKGDLSSSEFHQLTEAIAKNVSYFLDYGRFET